MKRLSPRAFPPTSFTARPAFLPCLLLALAAATPLRAQLPNAELHAISPPVIPAGATTEVSLTGLNLEDLGALHFSAPGIKAEPVMLPATEFRKGPIPNGTRFKVTVPADAAPGVVLVRAHGYFGLTTTRPLFIAGTDRPLVADAGAVHHRIETAPELALEALAHGDTDASQVDYWKFTAKKGQRLLVHCQAERIDSRADATLTLVDSRGHELERSRDAIGRDPMIDFTAPADGDYWVGVHDFLYNGGSGYPYLLSISARPWIDAVFPPAGQPGQVMEATLIGRNLPGGSPGEGLTLDGKPLETLPVRITVPAEPEEPAFAPNRPTHAQLPGFAFRHGDANPVEIGLATAPVIPVNQDADIPPVTPPCEIAARFDTEGDSDEFRFVARKGVTYWIEVIGDRLSGKIDPYLLVEKITVAPDGAETFAKVRDGDDDNGKGGPTFDAATRDTSLSLTADHDGGYRVTVIDQFAGGGPDRHYRLAIREAAPDFRLLAVSERPYLEANQVYPAAPLLRKGGTAPLKVLVQRRDGFAGPITLQAADLPAGVSCPPVTVAGKDEVAWLVFHATPDAPAWAGDVRISGTAKIGEAEVTRPAHSGSVIWATADRTKDRVRSRLDLGIPLAVSDAEKAPVAFEIANPGPLTVEMGAKLEIPVKITARNGVKGNLVIAPEGLHGLVKPPTLTIAEKDNEGKLTLEFKPVNNAFAPEAGTWSFVLKATGTTAYRHHPEAAEHAAEEQKSIEALAKEYTDTAARTKSAAEAARKALEQANQNLAAATDEARPAAEKAVADATAALDAAQKSATEAEAKRALAEKEKTAAIARAKALDTKAKEKDVKFAAYSLPLVVEVKPAPEPEKKG